MAAVGDGRIPCPSCGGLVHPVAGKCKHCKEDLAAKRTGRAQAAAALPPLNGVGGGTMPMPMVGGMPQSLHTIAPNPIAVPPQGRAEQAYQAQSGYSVLPPRQTGRSMPAQSSHSSWRSWPMLVIVLASIAIVVAVYMMVTPDHPDQGKHVVTPPAPEKMETDPLPPPGAGNSNGADPWGGHSQADPPKAPSQPITPRDTPDTVPNTPPPRNQAQPDDPFGGMGGFGGITQGTGDVMMAAMSHACKRLKSCPNADDTMTDVCEAVAMFPQNPPPNCDAAKKCFDAIDKMDCTDDLNSNPLGMVNTVQDCMKAATAC
ncbi:MAG: hypothetical protein QM831_03915 [Kofleriaceae bacterium]